MGVGKRSITLGGMLRLIGDLGEDLFPLTRYGAWETARFGPTHLKSLEEYFPSHINRAIEGLLRKGWVEKQEMAKGTVVRITESGKKQILWFELNRLEPMKGKWDGKWRMVFFDIAELTRVRRDQLRRYLKKLGLYPMQESVYVTPYNCADEIKYLREVLNVPHGVKLGVLEQLENSDELKKIFKL